jgi:murein DD-endopeptidase MepM/ murein hydrolase activator NlpD
MSLLNGVHSQNVMHAIKLVCIGLVLALSALAHADSEIRLAETIYNVDVYESVESVLRKLGLTQREVNAVIDQLKRDQVDVSKIRTFIVRSSSAIKGEGKPLFFEFPGIRRTTLLGRAANGSVVKIGRQLNSNPERHLATLGVGTDTTLLQRIEGVGLREQIESDVIRKIVGLFGDDVDWTQPVKPGDSIEILITDRIAGGCGAVQNEPTKRASADQEDKGLIEVGLTMGGKTKRLYGFDAGNGCHYFDANGRSAEKAVLRKPSMLGRLRYGFGLVFHPILTTYKFHSGVDWTSTDGCPVQAVSDGVVMKVESNAGRSVVTIRNTYPLTESVYGNLSKLEKDIVVGRIIRQRDVIGYGASNGFDSEAVVHYELRVFGGVVDSLNIGLPEKVTLTGLTRSAFQNNVERIDTVRTSEAKTFNLFDRQ